MAALNTLPDPDVGISTSGQSGGSLYGPGFVSVRLNSNFPVAFNRTNSSRAVRRNLKSQSWGIDITYNQLTRDEFEPIHTFLMSRGGQLRPFYVHLPQYYNTSNSTYVNYSNPSASPYYPATMAELTSNGISTFNIDLDATAGSPAPGDMFNIVDPSRTSHEKVYTVTSVETSTDYRVTAPLASQRILHIFPALDQEVSAGATLLFYKPKFKVVTSSPTFDYSLGLNNLYTFGISLQEVRN